MSRLFLVLAGLFGAAGVAAAAASTHEGNVNFGIAGNFLLFHAPAMLALSLLAGRRAMAWCGLLLALGVALFAGDLVVRVYLDRSLFPMAAPIGGGAMILGWLAVAACGIFARSAPIRAP